MLDISRKLSRVIHWRVIFQSVFKADFVVFLAVAGSDMHAAGARFQRDKRRENQNAVSFNQRVNAFLSFHHGAFEFIQNFIILIFVTERIQAVIKHVLGDNQYFAFNFHRGINKIVFQGDGKVGGQAAGTDIPNYYEPEEEQSKNRRKGPYMQFGKGGVSVAYIKGSPDMPVGGVSLYDDISATNIYTSASGQYADRAPVITDIFRQKRITLSDGENAFVGTPVLYFRANTASNIFRPDGASYGLPYGGGYQNWKYDYYDNYGFYKLPHLQEPDNIQLQNRFDDAYTHTDGRGGIEYFYDYITNYKVEAFRQPQNANGFITVSYTHLTLPTKRIV